MHFAGRPELIRQSSFNQAKSHCQLCHPWNFCGTCAGDGLTNEVTKQVAVGEGCMETAGGKSINE